MLLIKYFKPPILRRECWFNDGTHQKNFTRFFQSNHIPRYAILKKVKSTWVIELENWTFDNIHKKTRYDIRRVHSININKQYSTWNQLNQTDKSNIVESYNNFAKDKKVSLINIERLEAVKENVLFSCFGFGTSCSYHIYIFDNKRFRLLYSWAVLDKSDSVLYAGLNKFHTSSDIEHARNLGFNLYDFGGYNESRMNGIDKFKSRFGGKITIEYNYIKLV